MIEMSLWDIARYWYCAPLLQEQWVWFNKRFFDANHKGCLGWSFANDTGEKHGS